MAQSETTHRINLPASPNFVRLWFGREEWRALTEEQKAELGAVAIDSDGVWAIRDAEADLVQVRIPLRKVPEWAGQFIGEAAHPSVVVSLERNLRAALDDVYAQRNELTCLVAFMAGALGLRAWVATDPAGEPGFTRVLFIDLPTGQVSWHLPDSAVPLVATLDGAPGDAWDGHSTEAKRLRLLAYASRLAMLAAPGKEAP